METQAASLGRQKAIVSQSDSEDNKSHSLKTAREGAYRAISNAAKKQSIDRTLSSSSQPLNSKDRQLIQDADAKGLMTVSNKIVDVVTDRFWGFGDEWSANSPLAVYHTTLSPNYGKSLPDHLTNFKEGLYYCNIKKSALGQIEISENPDKEKHNLAQWRVGHYFSSERLPKTKEKKSSEKVRDEFIAYKFDIYEPSKGAFDNLQNISGLAAICYISQRKLSND